MFPPTIVDCTEAAIALAGAFEKGKTAEQQVMWLELALVSALKVKKANARKSEAEIKRLARRLLARSPLTRDYLI